MHWSIKREQLLRPLQAVVGMLGRPLSPILSHILIQVTPEGTLRLTGTDAELELSVNLTAEVLQPGSVTLPARKFLDICKNLPEDSTLELTLKDDRVLVRAGKSRFTLGTLPVASYPNSPELSPLLRFNVPQHELKRALEACQFAMANQDVRYYLNGMLCEVSGQALRTVATDGHRLALSEVALTASIPERHAFILPRKAVVELGRLLDKQSGQVELCWGADQMQAHLNGFSFSSKLVDGRFPDYHRVIPAQPPHQLRVQRDALKQALQRVAILSNEKFRGIRFGLAAQQLTLKANNPEQEEAEEVVMVDYHGPVLEIGFNVQYMQDVLGVLKADDLTLHMTDGNSSALITEEGNIAQYVIMPMRI